ncbi:MAG: hypothetical protein Q9226_008376 [Calogaya cf. arnoldii]
MDGSFEAIRLIQSVPLLRHFFTALEAAFIFGFRAINYKENPKKKCLWLLSDFSTFWVRNIFEEGKAIRKQNEDLQKQLAELQAQVKAQNQAQQK